MFEIPAPILTLKLSNIGPGYYLDGRPLGADDKNQSQVLLQEHVSQADGCQTLSRHIGSGKVRTMFCTA